MKQRKTPFEMQSPNPEAAARPAAPASPEPAPEPAAGEVVWLELAQAGRRVRWVMRLQPARGDE